MAIDARGLEYSNLQGGRVSYDLLTDHLVSGGSPSNNLKQKGPGPELVKSAIGAGEEARFFGAAPTYTPIYFDRTALSEVYGNQIFTNVDDQKNMVWLSEAVSGDCLDDMKDFIGGESFIETRYLQSAEGESLVDSYGVGPDLPYVSGFGVDQIFDFSPLSDDRWNKNAYVGNAFALPEYYDFPYSSEIYFDTSNPFHWKIKDCHYRFYEEQADSLTNISFAKLTYDGFGYGINCNSSGTAYVGSTTAYGEWEFTIKKQPGTGQTVFFISESTSVFQDGYMLSFTGADSILFRRYTGGVNTNLFSTASGYLSSINEYTLKVTRNSVLDEFVTGAIGTFAIYIKGGSFGSSYVLVDTTGGSGLNPRLDNNLTTSTYSLIDIDAGDGLYQYSINQTLIDTYNFTAGTAIYDIDGVASSDELLLYQEGKGLDCTTSGLVHISSTNAYGEWEFEGNTLFQDGYIFISDNTGYPTNDGYYLTINGSGRLSLVSKVGGGASAIFGTADNFITDSTFYGFRITRNSTINEFVTGAIGTFAVYIKGGIYGDDYVLVDVTGGSGSNPVTNNTITTSSYSVFDKDAGGTIRYYTRNGTLLDTRDFTQTTGEYVVTSELEDPELTQIKGYVRLLPPTYLYYIDEQ
jgi:hypothetical protein